MLLLLLQLPHSLMTALRTPIIMTMLVLPSTSGEGALLPLTSADDVDNISMLENSPLVGPGKNKSDSLVTVTRKKQLSNPPQTQEKDQEFIITTSVMQVVLSVETRFPRSGRQTRTRRKKKCSITHGYAKLIPLTVQQADTGGLFLEGEGVYCILCKKHNAHSTQNKQEKFCFEPSVRFKSTALSGHLNSKTHSEVLQLEQTQRGSIFQREISNRKAAETKTIECVIISIS